MIYGNFFKIKNQYGFLDRKIGTWMKMEKKNTWMIQYPEFQQFWSTGTAQFQYGRSSAAVRPHREEIPFDELEPGLSVTLCVDVEVAQCGEGHSSITTGFIMESYFMIILWSFILSYITYPLVI